jgi:hypothetical protein
MSAILETRNWSKSKFPGDSIGCAREQFKSLFVPFGTTMWTFSGVIMQSTVWESFIWTLRVSVVRLVRRQGPYSLTGGSRSVSSA